MTYERVFTENTILSDFALSVVCQKFCNRFLSRGFAASAIDIENANRPPVETNARAKLPSSPTVVANFAIVSHAQTVSRPLWPIAPDFHSFANFSRKCVPWTLIKLFSIVGKLIAVVC